jgi:DNA-directed RNA polymerase
MLYFEKGDEVRRARTVIKTITPIWEHYKVETPPIDKRKTKQAAYVNFVHAHDAIYLRKILRAAKRSSVEIAAVHDGFGVAYYNSK